MNKKRKVKVSWDKKERKIFGAYQWNAYVMAMYEDIFKEIRDTYGWDIQYGAKLILKNDVEWDVDIKTNDIKEFINRNKQLYDIFVEGISSCDLFIADITHHNPNVMLELGVAIQLNKNILIVTNQDLDKLPFDIRGLEAKVYKSKKELQSLIEKEIKIFNLIKDQNFDSKRLVNHYKSGTQGIVKNKDAIKIDNLPKLKNLRIRLNFRFLYSTNHKWDWFGIHMRAQGPSRYASELVLIRHTGKTRSLTWPEQRVENDGKLIEGFEPEDWHKFEILIDENRITSWVDGQLVVEDDSVIIESFGEIFISCNAHPHPTFFNGQTEGKKNKDDNYLEVEFKDVEVLDLNTTANLFN